MPTVTIEGPMDSVTKLLFGGTPKGKGAAALRNANIRRERKIIKAAFDRIRHDKSESMTVGMFSRVLGGKLPTTDSVLDTAIAILIEPPRS